MLLVSAAPFSEPHNLSTIRQRELSISTSVRGKNQYRLGVTAVSTLDERRRTGLRHEMLAARLSVTAV